MRRVTSSLSRVIALSSASVQHSSSSSMTRLILSSHPKNICRFSTEPPSPTSNQEATWHPIKPLMRQLLHIIPPERISDADLLETKIEDELSHLDEEKRMDFKELKEAANRLLDRRVVENTGLTPGPKFELEPVHESLHPTKEDDVAFRSEEGQAEEKKKKKKVEEEEVKTGEPPKEGGPISL